MGEIAFYKEIYSFSVLQQAVANYNGIATVVLTETAIGWECRFTNCKYDVAQTTKEFDNYCINLMCSMKNDY